MGEAPYVWKVIYLVITTCRYLSHQSYSGERRSGVDFTISTITLMVHATEVNLEHVFEGGHGDIFEVFMSRLSGGYSVWLSL
ncbi:hypothetical protein DSUL_40125 [Desulfovibrionales bacterium]